MSAMSGGFSDFEVLVSAGRGGKVYRVSVLESPAGQAEGEFRLPRSEQELAELVDRMRAMETDQATLTDFGGRLFAALFHGDVLSRYAESVGMTREAKGLRLRLHVEPPKLAALPWEVLYDPEKREFLGLSKRALITRYLHVPRPPTPLRIELPLRILIAAASPGDLPPLDIDAELERIQGALSRPADQNLIHYDVLRAASPHALRDALLETYHILHFIGHGDFEEGEGSLAFQGEQGKADLVSGRVLGTLLKNTPVRLVVLNACRSAQDTQNARAFTGVGPALVDAGLAAVVGMQFIVGDASARVFTQDFYAMLAHFLPVDECVSRAREGLMLAAGAKSVDWATPVLYLRAPDGVIFAPEGVGQIEAAELEKVKRLYVGALSTERQVDTPSASNVPGQKELISHLWAIVDAPSHRRWAEPHEALSRWVTRYEDGVADELSREDVAAVVEREPLTVILGEAGIGKTPNLERLAFINADRALRVGAEAPIPVLVKLSQYDGQESLVPLVREGLNRYGQLSLSPAYEDAQTRSLLAERRFLFLMDSLCQLPGDEQARAHGIAAVNRFVQEHSQHKHVIACRSSFYRDHIQGCKTWLILPHSDDDVQAFFIRHFGEARGRALYQDLPDRMRALARIPLLLSLLMDEVRERGEKAARQRGPLFANFVSRMLSQETVPLSTETQSWLLAGLAYAMKLDQTLEYTLDQVMKTIGREMSEIRLWQLAPQQVMDGLLASGLLRAGSTARVAFAHAWFHDYFAALAVQEKLERGQAQWDALVGTHWWRETLLFLPSMVQAPAALVRELLSHDPLAAARCWLETEETNGALGADIGQALAQREQAGTPAEREEATELLTQLHVAGLIADVADYRGAAQAEAAKGDERTTAAIVSILGHLVVAEGALAGLRFPLIRGASAIVGRSSKVDFVLPDESVSRRHFETRVIAGEVSIRDLGSTNGTKVNGERISDWQPLANGDRIELGELSLTVQLPESK